MKTRILTFLMLFFAVSAFAQSDFPHPEYYFPTPVQSSDGMNGTCVALVYLDGVLVETEAQLEVAFFDEEGNCRQRDFVHNWGVPYGFQFQSVMYGESNQTLTFKFYDHATGKSSDELGYVCITSFTYVPNVEFGELVNPETIEFFHSRVLTFTGEDDKDWYNLANWMEGTEPAEPLPGEYDQVIIDADCSIYNDDEDGPIVLYATINEDVDFTIEEDMMFWVTDFTLNSGSKLILEASTSFEVQNIILNDGALLSPTLYNAMTGDKQVTMKKSINAYSGERDNYYFISSPLTSAVSPENISGMLKGSYDLYSFIYENNPAEEWRNYKNGEFSTLTQGTGYLYANDANQTLVFKVGTPLLTSYSSGNLAYSSIPTSDWNGFNLIGNPYTCNAIPSSTKTLGGFYMINVNDNRSNVIVVEDPVVAPCTGVIVKATAGKTKITFTPTDEAANVRSTKSFLNLEVNNANGNLVDRAYVEMNEGEGLNKFNLNNDATQIYFQQNGKDYAIVHAERATQLPVFFKTREYGQYTINVKLENLTCEYLHLIDNITGMDIDLNATPSYTFRANQGDYAARFKIVFEGTGVEENTANENFAIVEGNRVIIPMIEHESQLEIIDMTGRTISSQKVNGSFDQTLNVNAGIYLLRMNGKVQKIVVR